MSDARHDEQSKTPTAEVEQVSISSSVPPQVGASGEAPPTPPVDSPAVSLDDSLDDGASAGLPVVLPVDDFEAGPDTDALPAAAGNGGAPISLADGSYELDAEAVVLPESAEMIHDATADAMLDEPSQVPDEALESTLAFYRREAVALAGRQAERAASMWLEAAYAAQQLGHASEDVRGYVRRALDLCPSSVWLMSRARRLLMRLRCYEDALKLGQREVKLGGENAARAALLVETAAVVRYRLNEPKVALQLIQQALQLHEHYVPALVPAVSISVELGLNRQAAASLEHLADCLTDPAQRGLCLYAAGTLHELCLQDTQAAQAAYLRATEADPQNVPAAFALGETYRYAGQWGQLCRSLEHLADLVDDPKARATLLIEAGSLHLDHTRDLTAASRDLARAARTAPESKSALRRLAYAYLNEGRTRETIQTLRQLQPLTLETQGQAALLTQIGDLHASLHETEQAIAGYREALIQIPGYLPAVQALGTLYRNRGDHDGLVAIARAENESMLPAATRAIRYVELAKILDQQLNRCEEAVEAYRRAIELVSDLHLAYWPLAELLRRLGWHEELAEVLARHAAICQDPQTRNHLLRERARVMGGPLGDSDAAIETLREALNEAAPGSAVYELADLYERRGLQAELVALLLDQAKTTSDTREAEDLSVRAALLLEQELDEQDRALELLRAVLKQNPQLYAAIHSLGRILHRRGAWEDLVKLYHHELVTDPERPDAASLLFRMGRIIQERLGNRSAAISAYLKVLRHDPTHNPALVALEDLVREEGRWEELVRSLEEYAKACTEPKARVEALCRAGDIGCWQLDRADLAEQLYQRALAEQPGSAAALLGLSRVNLRQQQWVAASDVLERLVEVTEATEQRAMFQLQLARIKEFRLDGAADLELYEQAAQGPFGEQLREELARLRRAQSDASLAQHLVALGAQTTDDVLAAAYLLDAAHHHEFGPSESAAVEIAQQAYDRRPGELATVWALERALAGEGRWDELATLSEQQAQLELDRTERVQQLARTAQAYWRVGALEEADRVCRDCLNFDAHCLPALRTLATIAEDRQDWRQLAEICDRLAEASADVDNRMQYCLRAATLWSERVEDTSRAMASLAVALADDPGQSEAFTRAESLLRQRGDFQELSRLYQRRIRATQQPEDRVALLWRHAQLLRDDLQQPERAITELNELLKTTPADGTALSTLAMLHEQLKHWSDAATALDMLLRRSDEPAVKQDARLRLASLWLDRLHEPRRAKALLKEADERVPGDAEVARLQIRVAMTIGEWQDAQHMLEQQLQHASGGRRVWALLQLADVARLGLGDAAQADSYTTDAIQVATSDPEALRELRQHYPSTEDRRRLADRFERLLADGGLSDTHALTLLLARLLVDDLGDAQAALPHLQQLTEGDAASTEIVALHAEALRLSGSVPEARRRFRLLMEQDPSHVPAYRGLARCSDEVLAASAATLIGVLGGELVAEEAEWVQSLRHEAELQGVVPPAVLRQMTAHQGWEEALELVAPIYWQLNPPEQGETIRHDHPASMAAAELGGSLRVQAPLVVLDRAVDGARVVPGEPMGLRVSEALIEQSVRPRFRFWVGRALVLGLGEANLLNYLGEPDVEDLCEAMLEKRPRTESAQRLRKKLLSQMSRKQRTHMEQMTELSVRSALEYRKQREGLANQVGIVLSRQPGVAVRELARHAGVRPDAMAEVPRLAALLRFAVSDEYGQLYRAVWG